jgi:hypothetical protein
MKSQHRDADIKLGFHPSLHTPQAKKEARQ